MAQAFYRKYRSKSLGDVIGQRHITETLDRAISQGKISHAYLFTGPRGVGKTSIARILAHQINKLPYDDESQHLDIIEIDAASNRRIDDIRDLREKVHIAPSSAAYKVYIIDEVHMLTGESFNALLKTLEEPPAHVVFILATTEMHKLPATIVSRTQRFHFKPINNEDALAHLKEIAKKEKIAINDEALKLLAEHGDGSFRDSIGLLDQLSGAEHAITASDVEQLLGLASGEAVEQIAKFLLERDVKKLHKLLQEELVERGASPQTLSRQLVNHLGQLAPNEPQLFNLLSQLLEVGKSSDPRLKLMICLMQFAAVDAQPKAKAPLVASRPAVIKQDYKPDVTKTTPTAKADVISPKNQDDLPALSQDNWSTVINSIKQTNPPLYSIIGRARADISPELLNLSFAFKLHQVKLDDSKYRQQLVGIINQQGWACPKIVTGVDKSAAKPLIDDVKAEPSTDATTASVLAMMGGGEIVDAKI